MYLNFYGLKEYPFNVTSDPGFLYLSNAHKDAIDHILYGINERKGFIEITGEIGAGKTTICKAILNRLSDKVKTSFIVNPNLSATQLLETILSDFGYVPLHRDKGRLFRDFNKFLLEEFSNGNNVVLIIDEAQNLSNSVLETIRMLSNFETEKEKLLQIILVGQPELKNKLANAELTQLRQRISVNFHLTALSNDELKKYVEHRLNVAGSAEINFDPDAMDLLSKYSKGIPRVANMICDKALLLGFARNTKNINVEIMGTSIGDTEVR
ncbi:peptidoglycan-binding domain 1 protein [Candidatus Omnitrophus magneticus]|uniref:Peptidoglycan-binding domain 1 protein n=1 Tax=Candidatus Omnitrophus magneticus TaxID=1609969 RepID=A0A0F0CQ33_9BACT|nr:peptidoglycan-binding domain 1 protein [Candidatus Omnitrophus magneticus]